jgi:hypothetical protein
MHTGENEKALRKIPDMTRLINIAILVRIDDFRFFNIIVRLNYSNHAESVIRG